MDCSRGLGLPVAMTTPLQYSVHPLRRMNLSLIVFKYSGRTVSVTETDQLLLCAEVIAVYSESHINALCEQNVGFLNVKLSSVHKVTTRY
jgi:hypothetical protein